MDKGIHFIKEQNISLLRSDLLENNTKTNKVIANYLEVSERNLKNIMRDVKIGSLLTGQIIEQKDNILKIKINNQIIEMLSNFTTRENNKITLQVKEIKNNKIYFSIVKNNYQELSLNDIVEKLNLKDIKDCEIIIEKFLEYKVQLNEERIRTVDFLSKQLALPKEDILDFLVNPQSFLTIIAKLADKHNNFFLAGFKRKNKKSKLGYYEFNMLYEASYLGMIYINLIWDNIVHINFSCKQEETLKLLESKIDLLKEKLGFLDKIKFSFNLYTNSLNRPKLQEKTKKISLKGFDIKI